jgi:ribonuclease III
MIELLDKLNIKPNNIKLYEQAFTHTSYAYENGLEHSYETLEFLGDAIVDAVISDYLYKSNKYQEGEMTKIRASYVCEKALYKFACDLRFSDYIKVGNGEKNSGGEYKQAIMADVFEAFVAAIYLDLGYEKTKEVTLGIIVPYIENEHIMLFNDYKSVLQEAVQTDKKSLEYELIGEKGPAHDRTFEVAVKVNDIVLGVGKGGSKKAAEQQAAKKALSILSK